MNPRWPIYIPSKGRSESRITIRALARRNIPFFVVVEPQEHDAYAAILPAQGTLLTLPWSNRPDGLVAARNWIRAHAEAAGHRWHWQLDDNIWSFYRLHRGLKWRTTDGTTFAAIEHWADRYQNVAVAGMQYELLTPRRQQQPPMILNTRVYSCCLFNHASPHWWRDIYNDDTDLCLRNLKDGWVTALFVAFLAKKNGTMRVPGGNTPIYQANGRWLMAQSLLHQHPDVTRVIWRYGRWQHLVDYSRFRGNALRLKPGAQVPESPDEFGMVLRTPDGVASPP